MKKLTLIFISVFNLLFFGLNAENLATLNISEFEKKQAELYSKLENIQAEINSLDEQNKKLFYLYNQYEQELKYYDQENDILSKKVQKQEEFIAELENQLREVEEIEVKIPNLISDMFRALETSIKNDIPFRIEERTKELNELKKLVDDIVISYSEKYSKLLELYLKELKYSFDVEIYEKIIKVQFDSESEKELFTTVLRVGRVGFYLLDFASQNAGYWDKTSKKWTKLPNKYISDLKYNIAVVKKEQPLDLINLIIPTTEIGGLK